MSTPVRLEETPSGSDVVDGPLRDPRPGVNSPSKRVGRSGPGRRPRRAGRLTGRSTGPLGRRE